MHRTAPTIQNYLAQNINCSEYITIENEIRTSKGYLYPHVHYYEHVALITIAKIWK